MFLQFTRTIFTEQCRQVYTIRFDTTIEPINHTYDRYLRSSARSVPLSIITHLSHIKQHNNTTSHSRTQQLAFGLSIVVPLLSQLERNAIKSLQLQDDVWLVYSSLRPINGLRGGRCSDTGRHVEWNVHRGVRLLSIVETILGRQDPVFPHGQGGRERSPQETRGWIGCDIVSLSHASDGC